MGYSKKQNYAIILKVMQKQENNNNKRGDFYAKHIQHRFKNKQI